MQSSFKSIFVRTFGQRVRAAETSREIGAPQSLPAHLHQFVGGGVSVPKSSLTIEAPRRGW